MVKDATSTHLSSASQPSDPGQSEVFLGLLERALEAYETPPECEEGERQLRAALLHIMADQGHLRCLLALKGSLAQRVVDAMYKVHHLYGSSEGPQRRRWLATLTIIAQGAKILPSALTIDAQIHEITSWPAIFQAPMVDILEGALSSGAQVCVKKYRSRPEIRGAVVKMFIKEAIMWSTHPHERLLPFEGVYRGEGGLINIDWSYLVSQRRPFGSLSDYLDGRPNADRRKLEQVVHGDVKSSNVFVDAEGRACLADFGLSRYVDAQVLEEFDEDQSMAPTLATDVWSLGCLIYEVYTGRLPFSDFFNVKTGPSPRDLCRLHDAIVVQGKRPSKPSPESEPFASFGLTDEDWEAMEWCWARDPAERPSVHELFAKLYTDGL
ncbi:kinase-like domain-containing protein [Ephemerocybe angulata]|uniref:Kinase-like domain-containing protein n=1 Tax=Ephemerocybe angulata TaxID=980116 RepID=A0A8H6I202_9AGAR|nr:kinase-like domain-containing protein [Tulosesus angulatus]